jgi:predicted alpha/beta hydrolase family esterase
MALDRITGKRALNGRFAAYGAFSKPIGNVQIVPHGSSASFADIEANPGGVLVAHSLGCALVAHVAAERPDLAIEAALLVAPADVESPRHTPQRLRGFAPIPRVPLPFRSVVVASTNDPYMALPRARELADTWGAAFVDAGPIGHINVEAGFGPWPAGERILRDLMLGRREPRPSARATLDV